MVPPSSVSHDSRYICKLKKVLYGLKQASRAWFEKFSVVIFSLGFVSNSHDFAFFIKYTDIDCIIMSLYIDDIIIIGEDIDGISVLKTELVRQFKMKDLCSLQYLLGIVVVYSSRVNFFLSQNMLQIFFSGLDLLITL